MARRAAGRAKARVEYSLSMAGSISGSIARSHWNELARITSAALKASPVSQGRSASARSAKATIGTSAAAWASPDSPLRFAMNSSPSAGSSVAEA